MSILRNNLRNKISTSAVIVNYFSSEYTTSAVKSLREHPGLGTLDIYVVDNSANSLEQKSLSSNLPKSVNIIFCKKNIGFGRACNLIFDKTSSDYFLLLNPDATMSEHSLLALQLFLHNNPSAGAVSPQAYWDDKQQFFIPPAHSPFLFLTQPEINKFCAQRFLGNSLSRFWRAYSIKTWQSDRPVKVNNICGGHALLRTKAVKHSGGLFDPLFFMYFEDTDLFLRLQRNGYKLYVHPKARAVHYYNQSDPEKSVDKSLFMRKSFELFTDKNIRTRHKIVKFLCNKLCLKKADENTNKAMFVSNTPNIPVPASLQKSWMFEWSPNADFIPSIGHFGQGKHFFFPGECLSRLAPGEYYLRLGSSHPLGFLGPTYKWIKHAPSQD